jgi:heat shock protein HslJ
MPDVAEQLHRYADALETCVPTVTPDEIVAGTTTREWRRDQAARRSRRMWLATAAAAAIVVVVVAGQLIAGGPIPFGAASDDIALRDALIGRRFVVSSITEAGQPKELVGPALSGDPAIGVIRFDRSAAPEDWTNWFADDVYVRSNGGCNSTSAGFAVVDGHLALDPEQSMTLAGCDQTQLEQDGWLAGVLNDTPAITLDRDRLTLATATTTIELVERAEPPSPPTPSPPGPLDPSVLTGRTFVATGALVGGVERRIVGSAGAPEPHRLRITFGAGTVSVSAGCNSGAGPYTIGMGRIDGLAITTERACPTELMEQDAWLNAFFSTPPTINVDGDFLTLGNQIDTVMMFVDEAAETPQGAASPFIDTRWNLDLESVPDLPESDTRRWEAYLIVTGADRAQVYLRDGCNVATGDAEVEATSATTGTITMGELERTDASCPAPIDQVAEVMTAIQTGEWSYEIDIDRLELRQGDRTVVLRTN